MLLWLTSFVLLCLTLSVHTSDNDRRDIHRIIIREPVVKNRGHRHLPRNRPHGRDIPEHSHGYYKKDSRENSDESDNTYEEDISYYKPRKLRRPLPKSSEEDYRLVSAPSSSSSSEGWMPFLPSHRGREFSKPSAFVTSKPKRIHEFVDITTDAPQRLAPPLLKNNPSGRNGMNYYNFKITQPGFDTNFAEESRKVVKKVAPQAKKLNGGYEVYEHFEDTKSPRPPSINALSSYLVKSIPVVKGVQNSTSSENKGRKFGSKIKRERTRAVKS